MTDVNRRVFLTRSAAWTVATSLASSRLFADAKPQAATAPDARRYRIAASDVMLLKRQKVSALKLAKDCGLDGVEVDMGSLGNRDDMQNQLRDESFRKRYLDESASLDIAICSIGMSAFYGQSYAEHPKADTFTDEWLDIMAKLGVRVGFLPLGGVKANLKDDADARRKVVERLKRAGAAAEKSQQRIGIEIAGFDAEAYARLLDEIGSPAVGVSYNTANALDLGLDLHNDLHRLGKERIAQVHCTDRDGAWLENNRLDVRMLKETLDAMGWTGWLVLERSRVPGKSVLENFSANARYLKSVFR